MCYITTMNNDMDINELDAQTKRLLDQVCEGIEIPSDEDAEAAVEAQHGNQ